MTEAREDLAAAPRRPQRRGAPCLWFTRLPLRELVEEIRAHHLPQLAGPVRVQFAVQERLVEADPLDPPLLSFHPVLDHAQTPVELFGALAKRALWPLAAVAARARGRSLPLPLAAICPEEGFADAWIERNLGDCVHAAAFDEEPEVRRGWQRRWLAPREPAPALELRRREADAALCRLLGLAPPRSA